MEHKINKIIQLIKELNKASKLYYNGKESGMSDSEFDLKFEELKKLEGETNFIVSTSPTQKVGYEVITNQNKIKHEVPMLSLAKCHSSEEVIEFGKGNTLIGMFKMDGISLRAIYNDNGDLIGLNSRGNGEEGSDLFYQRYSFENLPLHINVNKKTVIDGEAIITDYDFEKINSELPEKEKYTHSRNLTAGSLALLDTNISSKRHLRMIVWDIIEGCDYNSLSQKLDWADNLGFDIVNYLVYMNYNEDDINTHNNNLMNAAKELGYGIDGVVWKFNDVEYGKSLGRTSHHFNNGIAWKPEIILHDTILRNIEWQTSRTGLINPVAVFDEVDLEGGLTTKATLHNLSYINDLELGIGDTLQIYRANMVIPKVHSNLTRSNTWKSLIPQICPICKHPTKIVKENDTITLHCINHNCKGKQLGLLSHFVSKSCVNIEGLSEATLEILISLGYVKDYISIYQLKNTSFLKDKIPGFKLKSKQNLLNSIELSRNIELNKFIAALSIPGVGYSTSKDIANKIIHDAEAIDWGGIKRGDIKFWFMETIMFTNINYWSSIDGIGDKTSSSINEYFSNNFKMINHLVEEFNFIYNDPYKNTGSDNCHVNLNNKTFCITGSLNHLNNRDEFIELVNSNGGKYLSSVNAKLNYLVINDINSTSSKAKKAKELNVTLITEEEFLQMIGKV